MPTEYDYQRECDDIDEWNREQALKKKASIDFKLNKAKINDSKGDHVAAIINRCDAESSEDKQNAL